MEFSVLIPIYADENPEYFDMAIKSVINQTLKPTEIVIVKDGTIRDNLNNIITKHIKNSDIKIKVIEIKENVGPGAALNYGITECSYPYIARLDSDDVSLPDRFEKQLEYIKQHPEVDVIGGFIQEYDETLTKKISIRKVPLEDKDIKEWVKTRAPFNHSSVIYKKDTIIKVGNYKNKRVMEDYDLWIRCVQHNCLMHNIPAILANMRSGNRMYKRRGGIKYVKNIIEIENELERNQIINKTEKIKNILIRTFVAIMPWPVRKIIYQKVLRD